MSTSQAPKLVIIGIFLLVAVGVAVFAITRGDGDATPQGLTGQGGEQGTATGASGDVEVTIDFLYSTEKKAWIEEAVVAFKQKHPEIAVNLKGKGSLGAVRAILDAEEKPTVWSPADTVAINLLGNDWFQKERKKLFPDSGDAAPQPLVLTPLVFVAWEDRGNVLTGNGAQTLTWRRLHEVLSKPEGWKAIGGPEDWGVIRLGHTDPTMSNSGLQAIILMAYEYHQKTTGLEVKDALDTEFQEFVKVIEKGVSKFGRSTGTFMTDMVRYGPSKYHVVVAYENLAIEQLPNAQGRWGNLRVYYPKNTMWSSHPAVVLDAPWVTPEQKAAGRKLVEFLRGEDMQRRALTYGFRPADPSIPILTEGAENPFSTTTAYGVTVNVPGAVEPPPGPVINNLMEMWSRQFRR